MLAAEERQKQDLDEDEDTTASRFIARVLKFLLAGCVAKDKAVRFRVVQCIADMISHLGEIECVSSYFLSYLEAGMVPTDLTLSLF